MAKPKRTTPAQATWGGRFSEGPSELMARFSESVSFDKKLAPFDILGSKAHAAMLAKVGLISKAEFESIRKGLNELDERIAEGKFSWDPSLEDVHMNIEQALHKITPAAAKLHTARSRNDQVATDMRLYLVDASRQLQRAVMSLLAALVCFAEENAKVFLPGYTHLQRAQPVTAAHHFLAYVEMLWRDARRFARVFGEAFVSPLGSGAIAGTTLPIDRAFSARELGFEDADGKPCLTGNSMDAVSDRDAHLEFAFACSLCAIHLSRMAEDMILWNSSEFGFIRLPDAFTTGSSLMPQKKNPDCMELIRGKSARLTGNLVALLTIEKGLPLTYNRDLQEDKPPLFDSHEQLLMCLSVMQGAVEGAQMNPARCAAAVADPLLLATDLADYLVLKGVPFREAHHQVGALVALSEKLGTPLNKIPFAQASKAAPKLGKDWTDVFDLKRAFAKRENAGMPGLKQTQQQLRLWKKRLALG